jgi:hypothetical protein
MARKKKDPRKVQQIVAPEAYGLGFGAGNAKVTAGGKKPVSVAQSSDLKLVGANITGTGLNTSTVVGPDGKPITPEGKPLPNATDPRSGAAFLTPEEQEQARQAQAVAGSIKAAEPPQKSWIANLFDTSDTFDENGNFKSDDLALVGGEAVFDGFMRGLQWGFDRLNQYTVAAMSAIPGGTRTLEFDEANDVSFGQMLVANAGISSGRVRRGEANIGDALALSFGILPAIGAAIAGQVDPDTPVQQQGFDITSEKDREVFKNGAERFFSATGDFGFAFADPTLAVGWGAKIARLRYVDQLIDTPEKMQRVVNELADGKRILSNNLDTRYGTDAVTDGSRTIERDMPDVEDLELSPRAMFLHNAVKQNADGTKAISWQDIYNHKVIRYAGNRDALTSALYNARTYDEAALIMRHAYGDTTALPELFATRSDILAELIDGERELIRMTIAADPKKKAEKISEYQARIDEYDNDLEFLKARGADDPRFMERLDFLTEKRNRAMEDMLNVANDNQVRTYSPADIELAQRNIDRLRAENPQARRALAAASASEGSLYGGVKGFSANNKFGRFVEKTRQKRARAQYETETTRGVRLWEETEFAYLNTPKGKVTRALRVWRYLGAEAPAGIVRIAGGSAQESAREVRALLNSIRIYGGKGKQITGPDGQAITIGGSLRKEQLLTEFVNAMAEGGLRGQDAGADAIRKIEDLIQEDIEKFYGVNNDLITGIMSEIRTKRSELKQSILDNGFWVDPVTKKENKAPYLESQLEGSEIMANWRAIEKTIIADSKTAGHFRDASMRWGSDAYSTFQDLWRPAVLLRLGYTQRNVAEGLFRSTAFQFSLAPLGLAAKQAGYSTGNTIRAAKYGRQGARGVVEKATVRAREGATIDQMPKRFQKWYKAQVDAVDAEISHHTEVMDLAVRELAVENRTWRLAEQGRIKSRVKSLAKEKERLRNNRPAGMTQDQADATIARIDMLTNDLDRRYAVMDDITGGSDGPLPEYLTDAADNLLYFDEQIMPMLFAQREVLSNMRSAATMFREQTLAKRRIGQGQANVTDPKTLQATFRAYSERGAFDLEDSYTNIALANLSADHTSRQTLALRMSTAESILRHQISRTYVAVEPGQPQYFEGLATTLNQWKQSDVGEIIIRGMASGVKTDDEIATAVSMFLRTTPRGREIAAWITNGNRTANPGEYAAFGQRVAAAHQSALKAALPEREAADKARDAIRQAEDDVAAARAALAEAQKTNPKRKVLIGPDGKRITDPDKYVQRRRDAYTKAEQKYNKKVEDLSEKVKELPGFGPSLSVDDAMEYAVAMVQRYRQLTANSPELQRVLLARGSITTTDKAPLAEFAKELENLIGPNARNANGDPYQLIPIIGNAAEDVGSKSFMDAVRTASNKAFRVLGTIPEDTFVRAPFYSRRFDATYQGLTRMYLAQKPDGATLSTRDVNAIRQAAHQRALKDTKDWLYTIDRRTLLGQYGEAIFPFISASQNSVSAVGRIIWNDPRVAALMIMIWNAPSRAGLEDEEGRMHFSLPLEWVPESIRKTVGLDSMLDFTFSKDQFNLIAPPSGFGGALPIPVPGPAVVVPVSEIMKRGWFGIGPAAPDVLVGVLGQETADQVWEVGKSYVFGSDEDITGMSSAPLSVDKVLPAWGQKLYQFIQGEGSSSAYTAWYDKIYQSEYLKWAQGYRDEVPTPDEISDMTRNFYFLRMAMNLVAFTPPGFTSEITPVVEAARRIYENEPNSQLANMQIYEKFGPTVQQLLRIRSTESVAGLDATADSYRLAKNHADLIGAVAPRLAPNGTLNVIGVLAGTARGEYDPSFSAAQQLAKIPNTDRYFREVTNPAQAAVDSQISAGWAQYLRNMDVINAKLAERGLKSLQSRGAEDLMELKKAMVDRLRVDPRFEAWYGDYMGGVSSRTLDTVMTIQTALNDQRWRDAHKDDPIWGLNGAADQYMYAREQTREALASTDDPDMKRGIREQWQSFRFDLAMRYPDWAAKQERYLSGDEDPDKPQIVLTSDVVPFQPPVSGMMGQEPLPTNMSYGSM